MRTLRQIHLYLGCLFAPLLIYFSLSGVWQVYRFNDVPKVGDHPVHQIFHALSNPHTHSTLPGKDPETDSSRLFSAFAAAMGLGIGVTATLGIIIALGFARRPRYVVLCILAGFVLPVGLFLLSLI